MIWFYRIAFLPVFLVMGPYYIWRMLKRGGYGHHFYHRFGWVSFIPRRKGFFRIWIQAVSVGEVQAIEPLVKKLRAMNKVEVFLTTTTSTGYRRAKDVFGDNLLGINFFPLDFWLFSFLSWNRIKPDLCILMEAELWPEHIRQGKSRGVPVLLINGRMSDGSFERYKKCKCVSRFLLRQLDSVVACSEGDKERFISLGASEESTVVSGNMKLDLVLDPLSDSEKLTLKEELGFSKDDIVLMGASTWSGEEKWLMDVQKDLLNQGLKVGLLLVPRHAERRNEIIELFNRQRFKYSVRSTRKKCNGVNIVLADTTGELKRLVQVTDVVFVGKSLLGNKGGQSPIEIAAAGKAMIYGSAMSNFRTICRQLEFAGGAIKVSDEKEGALILKSLLFNKPARDKLSYNSLQWFKQNKGAVDRTLEYIKKEGIG
ncbi:MAG: hypothetical protein A2007_01175 [Verrucomicrobia bacterium GWC2_42_7]|nr:MAG: hypothetical protein A2007_01175 [Verrucomicrobia bacterium GWC2_42_7]